MKYTTAVLSDIHGNLEGLSVVMKDMEQYSPDRIVCLGDIIGYGPNPCECLEIMMAQKNAVLIRGNHEDIYLGGISSDKCSSIGKISAEWTSAEVPEKYRQPLSEFCDDYEENGISFFHTVSDNKHNYPYLNSSEQVTEGFLTVKNNISFYGHTHRPRVTAVMNGNVNDRFIMSSETIDIVPDRRYYINVGSVGQQRDTVTDCSYGLIVAENDNIRVYLKRLEYDSFKTYCKIKQRIQSSEIAEYLIREPERRSKYEHAYYGS